MSAEKRTDEDLLALLANCPKLGTVWVHYKTGNLYLVVGAAIAEATQEPLVIYHREVNSLMFARPRREWDELVEWEGQMVPRFRPRVKP